MANTNFRVFNEANTEANTYNDSEYTNATQRLNGVIPGMAISRMHNKMFRQWSVMAAAIGQYIASSGYNCVDNNLAGIVDALGKVTGVNIRKDSTAYSLGSVAFCGNLTSGLYLECTTPGTTASSIPTAMASAAENDTVTDGTVTWIVRKMASTEDIKKYTGGTRQKSTAYALGDCAGLASLPAEWFLECTTAGTTTASDLVITSPSVGATVTDGSVVWTIRKTASTAELANYLPLAGGSMTGKKIGRDVDNSDINLYGGTINNGASVGLNGPSTSTEAGAFYIVAKDTVNNKILKGLPAGTLTWDGANVLTDANGGYLPLAGGTMTGDLFIDPVYANLVTGTVSRNNSVGDMTVKAGAIDNWNEPMLILRGSGHQEDPSNFQLKANDSQNSKVLRGTPAGTLTWDGNEVLTTANGLPLSGGRMTGNIYRSVNNDSVAVFGGTSDSNAYIQLNGAEKPYGAGFFLLAAKKLSNYAYLTGQPNGDLYWDNNGVNGDLGGSAIVAKSLGATGYIKYASGLVMQWGTATNLPASQDVVPVTFPITFPNGVGSVVITSAGGYGNQLGFSWGQVKDVTTTGFKLSEAATYVDSQGKNWFAIGY